MSIREPEKKMLPQPVFEKVLLLLRPIYVLLKQRAVVRDIFSDFEKKNVTKLD